MVSGNFSNNDLTPYRRLSYEWHYALAELIDNSTHSYFQYEDELEASYEKAASEDGFVVRIVYDNNPDKTQTMSVFDNAYGMDLKDLEDAFNFNRPKKDPGRSQYGLGLKTAGIWIGTDFEIETSKLGVPHKYTLKFDFEKTNDALQEGPRFKLDHTVESAREDEHFTLVRFPKVNNKLAGRTVKKCKEVLGNKYGRDIKYGKMSLLWNGKELACPVQEKIMTTGFMKLPDGSLLKKDRLVWESECKTKLVTGWAGVYEVGGRKEAGFAQISNDRVVRGYPDAWRPEAVFGYEAPNSTINQRIAGEFEFIGFPVTQIKDKINLSPTEEDVLGEWLKVELKDLIAAAKQKKEDRGGVISDEAFAVAISDLMEDLKGEDSLRLHDDPGLPSEVLKDQHETLVASAGDEQPYREIDFGDRKVKVYRRNTTEYEPYLEYEVSPDGDLFVFLNLAHPFMRVANLQTHLAHCIIDAMVSHFKAVHPDVSDDPLKALKHKDERLRITSKIDLFNP